MADGQKRGEIAGVSSLDHGEAKQPHRLQDGDDAAYHKSHAVEIGNALRCEIERAAEQSREHKHSGHPEDMLQAEHGELSRRQPVIDSDVEGSGALSLCRGHECLQRLAGF